MIKNLLLILFIVFPVVLQAQRDTSVEAKNPPVKSIAVDQKPVNINIYPVPVRENFFTIRCDKSISFVKVTNIIGQDIFRARYNDPLTITKINLENPGRGMYLVTVIFSDGVKVVKKILVEQAD